MRSLNSVHTSRYGTLHPSQIRRSLLVLALFFLTWVLLFSDPSRGHSGQDELPDELPVTQQQQQQQQQQHPRRPLEERRQTQVLDADHQMLSPQPSSPLVTKAPHIPCNAPRWPHFHVPDENNGTSVLQWPTQTTAASPRTRAVAYEADVVDLGPATKDCVVYTVFVGKYEKTLKPYADQTKDCYWVAFTDQANLTGAPGWIVRPIPAQFLRRQNETRYQTSWHRGYAITKFVKMLPFLLFPSFIQHALYIDGDYHVINSMTVQRAIDAIVASKAPILFRRHIAHHANILSELAQCSARYKAVGTLSLLVKDYLMHVSQGMCEKWFDMFDGPDESKRLSLTPGALSVAESVELLSGALKAAFCFDDSQQTNFTARTIAQRFLFSDQESTTRRYPCQAAPNRSATHLPMLDEELLRGIPQPSGPHVPLYDCSMIAYRLNHPDAAVRRFSEEFLKQWHRDSSLHGKDQIPLVMLLWRTPGYFPAVLGDEFRTRGGNLLWKSDHGK